MPSRPEGLFLTWNRIGHADQVARSYEAHGLPVVVVENASWGNRLQEGEWLTMGRGRHNTAGRFPVGDSSRWDALGIKLASWREGPETLVLGQRGIGDCKIPQGWVYDAAKRYQGRIRQHPGKDEKKPLAADLADCGRVVTWGSGAAVKALMLGVPVVSEMPDWIAGQDNTDEGRYRMFCDLAWAQWTLDEIATGEPMARLL